MPIAKEQVTAHELVFGDKFDRTLQYIIGRAFKENTRAAYESAVEQIAGLRTFIIFLASEGGPTFATAIVMLQNASLMINGILRSPEGRV